MIWKKKGYGVTVASIKGGEVPLDPRSLQEENLTEHSKSFLNSGGHGIVIDGPNDPHLRKTLEKAAEQGKIISAVCHGPAAFVKAEVDGKPLVKGKKVTGFSNSEEKSIGMDKVVPFLLEDKLKELGAKYEKGKDWSPVVVKDGKLITGQNPQSSPPLAEEVAAALE
ncbi:g11150 [Coccomyxa elongata]